MKEQGQPPVKVNIKGAQTPGRNWSGQLEHAILARLGARQDKNLYFNLPDFNIAFDDTGYPIKEKGFSGIGRTSNGKTMRIYNGKLGDELDDDSK